LNSCVGFDVPKQPVGCVLNDSHQPSPVCGQSGSLNARL